MLEDQLFDIYEPIFCSRCAKIVEHCILFHFVSFCVFPCVITSRKVRRSIILALFLACYKLTLFLWLRIWGSLLYLYLYVYLYILYIYICMFDFVYCFFHLSSLYLFLTFSISHRSFISSFICLFVCIPL